MQETPQQYAGRVLGYVEGKNRLQILAATPKRLASLLKGKTKKQLTTRPAPERWSAAEIAAHFADAEVAISWRLRQMLSTNGVAIQSYDQDAWAATFDYAHRDPRRSVEFFSACARAT